MYVKVGRHRTYNCRTEIIGRGFSLMYSLVSKVCLYFAIKSLHWFTFNNSIPFLKLCLGSILISSQKRFSEI